MTEVREELTRTIMRLALVSHVSAMSLEPSTRSSDEDIGGKRPPGGPDWQGDRQPEYRQKTALYFVRRLRRCHTDQGLSELLEEAQRALWDWQHTPIPPGQPPALGDPQWKLWIGQSTEDAGVLATRFSVTRRYINKVRQQYRVVNGSAS